ncbi:MAG: beta-lactamase family protein, partial [Calditrichaeota bacterium]|nr:beta-lactamase family protein [Calditrichota bacterium]
MSKLSNSLFIIVLIFSSSSAQTDDIDRFIQAKMSERNIPGLQLAVIRNNQIIKLGSYGIANIEDSIPVDAQTVFAINSMTKIFTGVAVMQLVEAGKIKLEDPISTAIDSLPPDWQATTIEQLLTHTSGLPDMMDYNAKITATWEEAQKLPRLNEVDTEFRYNQLNYVLIGRLISKLSGMSFQDFIIKQQLNAVNAERTIEAGFGHYQNVIPHSARGYTYFITGKLTHVYEEFPPEFQTAAGMGTTATELVNWLIALQNGKLIKKENLKTLWQAARLKNGQTKGFGR